MPSSSLFAIPWKRRKTEGSLVFLVMEQQHQVGGTPPGKPLTYVDGELFRRTVDFSGEGLLLCDVAECDVRDLDWVGQGDDGVSFGPCEAPDFSWRRPGAILGRDKVKFQVTHYDRCLHVRSLQDLPTWISLWWSVDVVNQESSSSTIISFLVVRKVYEDRRGRTLAPASKRHKYKVTNHNAW